MLRKASGSPSPGTIYKEAPMLVSTPNGAPTVGGGIRHCVRLRVHAHTTWVRSLSERGVVHLYPTQHRKIRFRWCETVIVPLQHFSPSSPPPPTPLCKKSTYMVCIQLRQLQKTPPIPPPKTAKTNVNMVRSLRPTRGTPTKRRLCDF